MSPGGDTRTSRFRFDIVSPLGFLTLCLFTRGEVLSSLLPTLAVSAGLAEAVSFFLASLVAVAFFAEAFFLHSFFGFFESFSKDLLLSCVGFFNFPSSFLII